MGQNKLARASRMLQNSAELAAVETADIADALRVPYVRVLDFMAKNRVVRGELVNHDRHGPKAMRGLRESVDSAP
jgi:hypothetical protein